MKCIFSESKFYEQPCEGRIMRGAHYPRRTTFKSYYACEKHATENKRVSPFNGVQYTPVKRIRKEESKKVLDAIDGIVIDWNNQK